MRFIIFMRVWHETLEHRLKGLCYVLGIYWSNNHTFWSVFDICDRCMLLYAKFIPAGLFRKILSFPRIVSFGLFSVFYLCQLPQERRKNKLPILGQGFWSQIGCFLRRIMDYLTKKTGNLRAKDRHKMVSYFFAVPKEREKNKVTKFSAMIQPLSCEKLIKIAYFTQFRPRQHPFRLKFSTY